MTRERGRIEATRAVLSGNLWLVLLDSFLVAAAYLLAYLLRFGFVIPQESLGVFETTVVRVVAFKLLIFSLFRLYWVTWCYIGMIDLYNVLKANVVCSMVLAGGLLVTGREEKDLVAVVVLDGLLGLFFIAGTRVLIRLTYHQRSKRGILGPTGATAVRKKAVS